MSMPSSSAEGITWAANASLISTMSMSSIVMPARASAALQASIGPSPMISGFSADTPDEMMRASGVMPSSSARWRLITMTAAAPSFSGHALPAVTLPSGRKTGFSCETASKVTPARGPSSVATTEPSGNSSGVMSISKKPRPMASSALFWLITPYSSIAWRLTPLCSATFSAVWPIAMYRSGRPGAGVQSPCPPSDRTLVRSPGARNCGLVVPGRLSELPLS